MFFFFFFTFLTSTNISFDSVNIYLHNKFGFTYLKKEAKKKKKKKKRRRRRELKDPPEASLVGEFSMPKSQ